MSSVTWRAVHSMSPSLLVWQASPVHHVPHYPFVSQLSLLALHQSLVDHSVQSSPHPLNGVVVQHLPFGLGGGGGGHQLPQFPFTQLSSLVLHQALVDHSVQAPHDFKSSVTQQLPCFLSSASASCTRRAIPKAALIWISFKILLFSH